LLAAPAGRSVLNHEATMTPRVAWSKRAVVLPWLLAGACASSQAAVEVPAAGAPSGNLFGTSVDAGFGGLGLLGATRSADEIQRVIRGQQPAYRACYERGLAANPDLTGKVKLALTIAPDGSVSDARAPDSDLADPAVVACVVGAVRTLRFGTGAATSVTYPLLFVPAS